MGAFWSLILDGSVGLGGFWVARDGFRQPAGPARILATALLAWTWATVGVEVLGAAGSLSLGPLIAWAVLGLGVGAWFRLRSSPGTRARPSAAPDRGWTGEATVAVGLVLWASALLAAPSLLLPVKRISDGPIYHLYFAARWWKEGRLSLIATPFGENAAPYFPAVGDLWFTWLVTGWGGELLAKVGQAPFLLLAALAAHGICRRLGAGAPAAVIATSWFVTSTPFLVFSFEPNVDTVFIAAYLVALFFFIRYDLDGGEPAALILGGLAAGAAWGTKLIATVFVPLLLLVAALLVMRKPRPLRSRLMHLGLLVAMSLVLPGYWFGRNAWLTANPMYPLQAEAFGKVWLRGWYGPDAMRSSRYYLKVSDWRALADLLLVVFDPRMAPVWVGALVQAWVMVRPSGGETRWVRGLATLTAVNVWLFWALIPYRTQYRFLLPALAVATVPLALLLQRARWIRVLAVLLLALHMLTPTGWPWAGTGEEGKVPWDCSGLVPNAEAPPIAIPLPPGMVAALGLGRHPSSGASWAFVVLGILSWAVAWSWGRALETRSTRAWSQTAGLLGMLAASAGAMVWPWGVDPRRFAFPTSIDYAPGWFLLDRVAGPNGARVAYAGTCYPYYLLGRGLRNEVRYINIDEHRDWLMHDYHRAAVTRGEGSWHNARPGWDRDRPDYRAWLANLRAAETQLLFVSRTNPADGWHNHRFDEAYPIERQWADAHREVFEPVDELPSVMATFRLYRLRAVKGP